MILGCELIKEEQIDNSEVNADKVDDVVYDETDDGFLRMSGN